MPWPVPFLLVPAAIGFVLWNDVLRGAVTYAALRLFHAVNRLCSVLACALDFALPPDSFFGRVSKSRLALWFFANAAIIVALHHLWLSGHHIFALVCACIAAALHVLLLGASIFKIAEENRIMHVGRAKDAALFNERSAVRVLEVVCLEIALLVASMATVLEFLNGFLAGAIIGRVPATGSSFIDHVICVLAALPVTSALVGVSEFSGEVEFVGLMGAAVRSALYVMGSGLLLGSIIAWVDQQLAIAEVLGRFGEADGIDAHFVQLIASRAPPTIKSSILALAMDCSHGPAQRRAISTIPHLKVWTFPLTFLHQMVGFERPVQIYGLAKIVEFLSADGDSFETARLEAGLKKALQRYNLFARKTDDRIKDAVLSRLGVIIARYGTLLRSRDDGTGIWLRRRAVMYEIATTHKSGDIRGEMVLVLLATCPGKFMVHYLGKFRKRVSTDVDIEIVQAFARYLRTNRDKLSRHELRKLDRRLRTEVSDSGCNLHVRQALEDMLGELARSQRRSGNMLLETA